MLAPLLSATNPPRCSAAMKGALLVPLRRGSRDDPQKTEINRGITGRRKEGREGRTDRYSFSLSFYLPGSRLRKNRLTLSLSLLKKSPMVSGFILRQAPMHYIARLLHYFLAKNHAKDGTISRLWAIRRTIIQHPKSHT